MNPKEVSKTFFQGGIYVWSFSDFWQEKESLGISQTDEKSKLKYVINDLYTDLYKMFDRSSSSTRRAFDIHV